MTDFGSPVWPENYKSNDQDIEPTGKPVLSEANKAAVAELVRRELVPSVERLRTASRAIYLAVEEPVASEISILLKWSADEIERLQRTAGEDGAKR